MRMYLLFICTILGGCAAGNTAQLGFFGGMHTMPYSDRIEPGRIYTTLRPTNNKPVFGERIAEICEKDTATIRQKFSADVAMSSSFGAETAKFTASTTNEATLSTIALGPASLGGSGKHIKSQSYEFGGVVTKSVSLDGAQVIRMNVGANCKNYIAQYKRMGRYVFVAQEVVVPKTAKISTTFTTGASADAKLTVTKSIAPGGTIKFDKTGMTEITAKDKAVEVSVVAF